MAVNQEIHDMKKEVHKLEQLHAHLSTEVRAIRETHGKERKRLERKVRAVEHQIKAIKTHMREDIRHERKVTKLVKDKARAIHEWNLPRP